MLWGLACDVQTLGHPVGFWLNFRLSYQVSRVTKMEEEIDKFLGSYFNDAHQKVREGLFVGGVVSEILC